MKSRLTIFALLVIGLGGCASPARVDQMVVRSAHIDSLSSEQLRGNIRVTSVIGGDNTNPLWTSEISSEDFRLALRDLLKNSGLLSELRSSGKFELEASLREVKQPMFGTDLTVSTTVLYTLVDAESRESVFEEEIAASYTAKFSDSFLAVERLRLANEGAAKKNIEKLIARLREIKI